MTDRNYTSLAWNGSTYVATEVGTFIDFYANTSTDGATFTRRTVQAATANGFSVAWNGAKFVITSETGGYAASSTDGITWAAITMPVANGKWTMGPR